MESHISFHTWPQEGVITLDLFTCGSKPLIPSMPLIEELFGVSRQYQDRETGGEAFEKPRLLWIHKMRGFRKKNHELEEDIGWSVVHHGEFEYKREVASTKTKFQSIQIYDFIDPRFNTLLDYEASISNSTSYQSSNKDLYLPNRAVFLDGVLQSSRKCDEAYHEILVHPAMFTHPSPRRVAIIGGGEGATLREVLKHETVETATMIEIDDDMMKFSREHLPSWTDCSDIIGSRESCFDDPRAEVYALDAMEWFMDNFDDPEGPSEEKYDVIIMVRVRTLWLYEFTSQTDSSDVVTGCIRPPGRRPVCECVVRKQGILGLPLQCVKPRRRNGYAARGISRNKRRT